MSLSDKLKSFMQQKENDNLKAGEEFLAENAKREGVVALPSGLQSSYLDKRIVLIGKRSAPLQISMCCLARSHD